MKIKRIKIENNEILWSFEMNFCDSTGKPLDTIIFIWENWSWKSSLMNIIYEFSEFRLVQNHPPEERRVIEVNFSDEELEQIHNLKNQEIEDFRMDYFFNFDFSKNDNDWEQIVFTWRKQDSGRTVNIPSSNLQRLWIKKIIKSIFSDVSINFNWWNVSSVTNSDTDITVKESRKSTENISTEITQMLVDIRNKDNEDNVSWQDKNKWKIVPEEMQERRTKRFKKAFSEMFGEEIKYVGVRELQPTFEKQTKEINIGKLSSWEKQIVFRWSYLLKDKENLKWTLVLIDEPEISLHPTWQHKILRFYQNLFTDESRNQTSQIFITTHSPYLLQSYNPDKEALFIFPKKEKVTDLRKFIWNDVSLWSINYYAYNLATIEFHDELYWYIKSKAIDDDAKNEYELNFEDFLVIKWLGKTKKWSREKEGIVVTDPRYIDYDMTLQTFIRNKCHHPENRTMESQKYSHTDLEMSIQEMLELIKNHSL